MRQERLVALLWLSIWMFTREDELWPKIKMAASPDTIMPDVDKVREQGAANFRATAIVELAIISLLIDAGMTTTEAAIQRIEQIQNALFEKQPGEMERFVNPQNLRYSPDKINFGNTAGIE